MDNKMVTTGSDYILDYEPNRFVDRLRSNVKTDLIEITHDKLENILLKHLKNLDIRRSWITPLSILLTVLITRITTTFKDALGITKDTWDAFFLILLIASIMWLVWSIVVLIINWKSTSLKNLICIIKASEK